jgi:hypothetical protein
LPNHRVTPINPGRRWLINTLVPWRGNGVDALEHRPVLPSPSMVDTLLGAIDIMQEAIAQRRFASEPPDVLLTPCYRAAAAIAEGRNAVAQMLPAIRIALAA